MPSFLPGRRGVVCLETPHTEHATQSDFSTDPPLPPPDPAQSVGPSPSIWKV